MGAFNSEKWKVSLCILMVCVLAVCLSGCLPEKTKERNFQVLDKTFVFPANYKYGGITRKEIPILAFTLDINTFENIGHNTDKNKPQRLQIEILPLYPDPEKTKAFYWTNKVPIHKTEPYNCKDYHEKFEVCQYDQDNVTPFADAGFFIRDKKTGEYLSVYGCGYQSTLPAPHCRGRSHLLDNLQIWYTYPVQYSDISLELDEKIRAHVLSLFKLSQEAEKTREGAL